MTFAVLCPGQGAQHPRMLDLYAGHPAAEAVLASGADALGVHVREWLARADSIHDNAIAQPLLCLAQRAAWAALCEAAPAPLAFAGYSVGELAAHGCAGALAADELARLARARAAAMDAACPAGGGLIALRGIGRAGADALCAALGAHVAIVNGDDAFVIGGAAAGMERIGVQAAQGGATVTCLKVAVPAHTPLLAAAVAPFRRALEASALRAPDVPVVAGIDGTLVTTRSLAIAALSAQLARTIVWSRCLEALYERGCRVFLELGPGNALSRMARERLPAGVEARALADFRTLDGVTQWLRRRTGG